MTNIAIPLQITRNGLLMETDDKRSIDHALSLLIQTACYSWLPDPQYGFILKNLRFEIFNENEGTIFDSVHDDRQTVYHQPLYRMKVTGTSKNVSTFAAELKNAIERYEPRLEQVTATLTYIREERRIYITVKGVIKESHEDYGYETTIKIWK